MILRSSKDASTAGFRVSSLAPALERRLAGGFPCRSTMRAAGHIKRLRLPALTQGETE